MGMKIAIVSQHLNGRSGHSRQALELASYLSRMGISSCVISINPTDLTAFSTSTPHSECAEKPSHDPLLCLNEKVGLWSHKRKEVEDVDLIHCFDISSAIAMKRYCQKRIRRRIPIVVSVTSTINLAPRDLLDAGPLSVLNLHRLVHVLKLIVPPCLTSYQLNGFDSVLCYSSFIRRHLLSSGVESDKVTRIGYGIDPTNLPQPQVDSRNSRVKLLYLGWGSSLRGTNDALDAFLLAQSQGFGGTLRFEIVGSHTVEEKLIVSNILESMRDHRSIRLNVGYNSRIRDAIADSDAVLLPFRSVYGYCHPPLSLLEPMLLGKPVISTQIGSIPEFVEHARTGLLAACHDIEGIAECISALASPQARDRIGQAGKYETMKVTDWGIISNHLLSCYEKVSRH